MNRRKAVLASLRLVNSFFSTQYLSNRSLYFQVTQFSHPSLSNQYHYRHHHHIQKSFFSSTPNSVLQLVLSNDWSDELETELLKSNQETLTHETVIYILKNLDKDPEKASDFFSWVCEKTAFKPSSSIYSLMLRIFVQNQLMKQFWVTIREMKEQGSYIDEETYLTILGILKKAKKDSDVTALTHFYNRMIEENVMNSVVKKVVDIIVSSSVWSNGIKRELDELKLVLSDNFIIRVLKELRNNPAKSLKFFQWVDQSSDFKHNTITFNAIARVLARDESIEEFWTIIEEMKSSNFEVDIDTYVKISRQFQKSKLIEDAVKLYELMMDGPYKPSDQHCTMLLRMISTVNNPDLNLVFRVAKKYESTGHTLSKPIYDGIHRSLTSSGRFQEAENILEVMRNAGFEPNNITYSQVIFGLCKAKRYEEAGKFLEEMEVQGCMPDIKTWTILIQGHCAGNEVDKALFYFAKVIEKNCEPDADLLDVLIDGFLSQNKLDGAYQLLVEMVDKASLRPWQATYKLLIEKLLKVRRFEESLNLLRLMKKQNYPPFPGPFVEYVSKFGTVEDGIEFFKVLSVKAYPSIVVYSNVFKSYFKEGRYSEAKDLLYKCPHHVRKHSEICKLFGSAENSSSTSSSITNATA